EEKLRIRSMHINEKLSLYSSISSGYSTPTIAEIKPSASGIYSGLQAEYGYNKEFGLKAIGLSNKLKWDLSVFRFDLKDAIVRRTNDAGQEYFVNAGGTIQKGLESSIVAIIFTSNENWLKELRFLNSVTLYNFKFKDYTIGGTSYNNNKITGVPDKIFYSAFDLRFKNGLYGFLSMNYNASIPLNDKNDAFADSFKLWQMKLGYRVYWRSGIFTDIYAVVDNIGNAQYSLGNDINAFGKRYFNPAPERNFNLGIKFIL
ncbi:MAG: hypothetical protein ACO29O_09415, partial [Chitinophagaceae bacterium]